MRIYFLLIFFFIHSAYAEFLEEHNISRLKLQAHQYEYSIKDLPEAVKKHKDTAKKYIPGDFSAPIDGWNRLSNNPKSSTDIIFNNNPALDTARYNGKGPTHREQTDKQHEILRNRTLDFSASPVIKPNKNDHVNLDNLIKHKILDKLLPSFKTRIDL